MRNRMYDAEIKKTVSFELPVIGIGNLSAGGTGKTPHVEYIIRQLQYKYKTGVLSRGYGRKTTGYLLLEESSTAEMAGDEPLQIKIKFPKVMVAICEERAIGIPIMLLDNPSLEVILLDDAFQHRRVKAGLSILLTEYSKPFFNDHLLPWGRLREPAVNASRADAIVVTKCNAGISSEERAFFAGKLSKQNDRPLFFSYLKYGSPYSFFHPEKKLKFEKNNEILLVCGIADPSALYAYLQELTENIKLMKFRDHHNYSPHDIRQILIFFSDRRNGGKSLITTEKDAVRLITYQEDFKNAGIEIYCVPVMVDFFDKDKRSFDQLVFGFVERSLQERKTLSRPKF